MPVNQPNTTTRAVLVSSDDFDIAGTTVITPPVLSIFLCAWRSTRSCGERGRRSARTTTGSHLPLELHFLPMPWAANAEHEQRILGSAMRCIDETPVLAGPLLDTTHGAGFAADEALQVVPGDLDSDGIMRIWDTLDATYRVSVSYG